MPLPPESMVVRIAIFNECTRRGTWAVRGHA
jgi:hypothetical protein